MEAAADFYISLPSTPAPGSKLGAHEEKKREQGRLGSLRGKKSKHSRPHKICSLEKKR